MRNATLAALEPVQVALPTLPKVLGVQITSCKVVKDGGKAHITYHLKVASDLKPVKMAIAALNTRFQHMLDEERFELTITVTCTDGENTNKLARTLALLLFKPVQVHRVTRQPRATSAAAAETSETPTGGRGRHGYRRHWAAQSAHRR